MEAGVTHDIVLGGQGYMLVAGSYRRLAGVAQAVPKGVATGGQYRQMAWRRRRLEGADGESIWVSEGFLPAAEGAALAIAPAAVWDTSLGASGARYGGGAALGGFQYVAVDATLYKLLKDGSGNYAGLSAALTLANPVKQIITHQGKLYFAEGAQYGKWDGSTLTETAPGADLLASYAGVLVRATGGTMQWTVDESVWRDVPFYLTVTGFLPTDDGLLIGTEQGLYRMTGRLTPSNPATAPATYDLWDYEIQPVLPAEGAVAPSNFRVMQRYAGGLYYWLGGWLWRWDGRQAERQPVRGTLYGLALAGPYLAAAVRTAEDGHVLWLHDGAGWWQLARSSGAGDRYVWPVGISQLNDAHLVCWAEGKRHLARWNFSPAGRVGATGHAAPSVCLPALDGGAPEVTKQWTAAGFELGAPEGPAALAAAPATWLLDYSTDAGATWTQAGALTPDALVASAEVTLAVAARRLWLRVRCTGGGPNNPALRTVWARWAAGVTAAARRRWEFKVVAGDGVVTLSGAGDGRDGRQIARELAALAGGGPVTFHDLRYAASGESATVQVVEVEEQVGRNLEPHGGESVVRVVLEEL